MTRALASLRRHAIATLALVCSLLSLAGASYAAFSLPPGSVGARELRNSAITASKLDPTSIAASIHAWVNFQWTHPSTVGSTEPSRFIVQSSSSDVRVGNTGVGTRVEWPHTRFARDCMASVTPRVTLPYGRPQPISVWGYWTTEFDPSAGRLVIWAAAPTKAIQLQSANVLIVCPTP
jgi:hypothetical protein